VIPLVELQVFARLPRRGHGRVGDRGRRYGGDELLAPRLDNERALGV